MSLEIDSEQMTKKGLNILENIFPGSVNNALF